MFKGNAKLEREQLVYTSATHLPQTNTPWVFHNPHGSVASEYCAKITPSPFSAILKGMGPDRGV